MVLRHSQASPDRLALQDDDETLSYRELAERVADAAAGLSSLGVRPGDRVAVQLDNSVAFVTISLACLWLGAPFVPLAVKDPPDRTARIVADCEPALLVTTGDAVGAQAPGTGRTAERHVGVARVVPLRTVLGRAGPTPAMSVDPERDAYLIYTSGTTGVPKGVRIPERAFRWAVTSVADLLALGPGTRALAVSSFHFDGSYNTLFPTLVAGGTLCIRRRDELLFLKPFFNVVLGEGITHTSFSPSYLRLLLGSRQLSSLRGCELRTLGLGGEECVAQEVATLWELLPELRVFNLYGPTEATISATTYEVTRADVRSGTVPIGEPHAGVSFCIVAPDGAIVNQANEVGELYIGGEQLMRGYWGDEELSQAVLRREILPGQVMYKTGDLVYRDEAGRYVHVGRTDDVVKRNGVRVSLTEVARAFRGAREVTGALCLPFDQDGRLAIAAFVEAGQDVTVARLLEATRRELPMNMQPDEVFILSALPMTGAGKMDRRRLLADAGLKGWQER
jgi:amino acid adenylation domain-containing protein